MGRRFVKKSMEEHGMCYSEFTSEQAWTVHRTPRTFHRMSLLNGPLLYSEQAIQLSHAGRHYVMTRTAATFVLLIMHRSCVLSAVVLRSATPLSYTMKSNHFERDDFNCLQFTSTQNTTKRQYRYINDDESLLNPKTHITIHYIEEWLLDKDLSLLTRQAFA
jgi:hypothetical protein